MTGKTVKTAVKSTKESKKKLSDRKVVAAAKRAGLDAGRAKKDAEFIRTMTSANAPEMHLSKESTKSTLPDMRKPGANNSKKLVEHIGHPQVLRPKLLAFLKALEDPWSAGYGARCPVNYNPVPTYQSSVAHGSVSLNNLSVAAASATEFVLFGGHGTQSDVDSMDGVAYHSGTQTINATTYSIGPVATSGVAPAIGFYAPGLAVGASAVASNVAGYTALTPDVGLPYTGTSGDPHHTRWKLVSMGVKFENTTQISTRAGNIVYSQPASGINYAAMREYGPDPTYGESTAANVGTLQMTWSPRPQDLAYWHTDNGLGSSTAISQCGFHIWLCNPSATAQTYMVQIVCNWEIAGQSLVAISSPGVHQPADRAVIEPTLEVQKFGSGGSDGAVAVGTAVAHTTTGFAIPPRVQEVAMKAVAKHGRSIGQMLESVLGNI